MNVRNNLAHLRNRQGLSAKKLAEVVGVQRQTIYAMESGTYVPNTLIALRLAQVLGAKVEDLFSLEDAAPGISATQEVDLLPLDESLQPGQPVQLCRVQKSVVGVPSPSLSAFLPVADAVVVRQGARKGRAFVQPFVVDEPYGRRLLIAGCDPGISVLGRHLKNAGIELVMASCSSSKSLDLLKHKQVHVAGSHLRDEATGESNLPTVRKLFPARSVSVVNFAVWEQGVVMTQGNPKGIRKVEDIVRKDLRLMNRETGAGSRLLLDSTLRGLGCKTAGIRGYDRIAYGHIPAAWHVHSGQADYCIATRAAARVFGLDFLPLMSERFDLVIPKQFLELATTQVLLETLNRAALQRELELLGGYDTTQTGKVLA